MFQTYSNKDNVQVVQSLCKRRRLMLANCMTVIVNLDVVRIKWERFPIHLRWSIFVLSTIILVTHVFRAPHILYGEPYLNGVDVIGKVEPKARKYISVESNKSWVKYIYGRSCVDCPRNGKLRGTRARGKPGLESNYVTSEVVFEHCIWVGRSTVPRRKIAFEGFDRQAGKW